MLAQELHNAGLFLGQNLMGAHISNADGHFEDMDVLRLHEQLLEYHKSDWRHNDEAALEVPEPFSKELSRLAAFRDSHYQEWGFKEPRTVLFLPAWQHVLSRPYTLIVYRHYSETSRSLLHRAAGTLLVTDRSDELQFWKDTTLAYRMWLTYNKKLVEHAKAYPETTLVIAHEALLEGYPITETVRERFGFKLDRYAPSGIKPSLVSENIPDVPLPEGELLEELDQCWEALQALSIVPSRQTMREHRPASDANALPLLQQTLSDVFYENRGKDPIKETLECIQDSALDIEDKIRVVRENIDVFFGSGQEQMLIDALELALKSAPEAVELWRLLGDAFRRARRQCDVQRCDLMISATAQKIFPWHYARLAEGCLSFWEMEYTKVFIDKALNANPNNPQFYLIQANYFRKNFQYNDALSALSKAIEIAQTAPKFQIYAMFERCAIFELLYDKKGMQGELQDVKTKINLMPEVPTSITERLASFEGISAKTDVKEHWKKSAVEYLDHNDFNIILNYMLRSIPNPTMRDDLVTRLREQVSRLGKISV